MHAALVWIFPEYLPLSFVLLNESVLLVIVSVSPTPWTKPYNVVKSQSELLMKLILLRKLKPSNMQDLCQCYEEAAAFIFAAEDGSIRVLQNVVLPHRQDVTSHNIS